MKRIKKIKTNEIIARFGVLSLALFCLTGCTGVHSQFGCNQTAPDTCIPVDVVNQRAEAGIYNAKPSARLDTQSSNYQVNAPFIGKPVRYGEVVQRIWLAPFEDDAGNYHEPSFIYTVLQSPHWQGLPHKKMA